VSRRSTYHLEKTSLRKYRVGTPFGAYKMSYKILKSFWELLTPQPHRESTRNHVTQEYKEYDEVIAINEVGETVILHLQKNYSLSYK
jgi:hypothetical protein